MKYGNPPEDLGVVLATCDEMMHYQCLPIKLINTTEYRIPKRLQWVKPMLDRIPFPENKYVYLTVRNTFITKGFSGSRPGWHSDGFLTNDISYIWSDCLPTEFAIQEFSIDENCNDSLRQFDEQYCPMNVTHYDNKSLLKLDSSVIHRPANNFDIEGLRAFVKISVSSDRYNLYGNSHNHLLDYKWGMIQRNEGRNHQKG
tara:strand:+ start:256 stop:855 length:600 start_codon:yes stop_codon:yes gene_type:complete